MQNIFELFFFVVIIRIIIEFIMPKKRRKRNYYKKTEKKSEKEKLIFIGIIFLIVLFFVIINYLIKIGKYISENIVELSMIVFIIGIFTFLIVLAVRIFFETEYENIKNTFKNIFINSNSISNQDYNFNKFEKPINTVSSDESSKTNDMYKSNTHPNSSYSYFPKQKDKKSNVQKGKEYEEQIGKYYEDIGYHVVYHGLIKGKRDKGIDLIATKEDETLLIQCKNWENSKVKQKDLKEFLGNCSLYLERNHIPTSHIKKLFITSNQNKDYGVMKFMQENHQSLEYKIIPYNN